MEKDLLIIGSGPAGLRVGEEAKKAGDAVRAGVSKLRVEQLWNHQFEIYQSSNMY